MGLGLFSAAGKHYIFTDSLPIQETVFFIYRGLMSELSVSG